MPRIHKLLAAYKDYLWGGERLKKEYGKKSDLAIVAESWELSTHPDGPSMLEDRDQTLAQYLAEYPEKAGTAVQELRDFPILIKLIDAASNLSVQVHPDDDYALKNEGQFGKTEMWYIVDCKEGAFIYFGFKEEISREEFILAIEDNTIEEKLNKVQVKKGDCFFIPAGTIHAIGAGCLIAEVQQNSNVTYRVYDYARKDAAGNQRELHVDKAIEVTTLGPAKSDYEFGEHLVSCPYFTVDFYDVEENQQIEVTDASFAHILVTEGSVQLKDAENSITLRQGDSAFVEAGAANVELIGKAKVLHSFYK